MKILAYATAATFSFWVGWIPSAILGLSLYPALWPVMPWWGPILLFAPGFITGAVGCYWFGERIYRELA